MRSSWQSNYLERKFASSEPADLVGMLNHVDYYERVVVGRVVFTQSSGDRETTEEDLKRNIQMYSDEFWAKYRALQDGDKSNWSFYFVQSPPQQKRRKSDERNPLNSGSCTILCNGRIGPNATGTRKSECSPIRFRLEGTCARDALASPAGTSGIESPIGGDITERWRPAGGACRCSVHEGLPTGCVSYELWRLV
jgi:hypothetical protein